MTPSQLLKLLSDETRLRCLALLMHAEELCVCEFTSIFQVTQTKMSRHLSMLRLAGVVLDERRGLWIYYRINPNLPPWAQDILKTITTSIDGQEPFVTDRSKISKEDCCSNSLVLVLK